MDQGMKYQKQATVVDAWRYLDASERTNLPDWVIQAINRWPGTGGLCFNDRGHIDVGVESAELVQICVLGDWIVRYEAGKLERYTNEAFWLTFEEPVNMSIREARRVMFEELKDEGFRLGYVANIAMLLSDIKAGDKETAANAILDLIFKD